MRVYNTDHSSHTGIAYLPFYYCFSILGLSSSAKSSWKLPQTLAAMGGARCSRTQSARIWSWKSCFCWHKINVFNYTNLISRLRKSTWNSTPRVELHAEMALAAYLLVVIQRSRQLRVEIGAIDDDGQNTDARQAWLSRILRFDC